MSQVFTDNTGTLPRLSQVNLVNPVQTNIPVGLDTSGLTNVINTITSIEDMRLRNKQLQLDQQRQEATIAQNRFNNQIKAYETYSQGIVTSKGDGSLLSSMGNIMPQFRSGQYILSKQKELLDQVTMDTNTGVPNAESIQALQKKSFEFTSNKDYGATSAAHTLYKQFHEKLTNEKLNQEGIVDYDKLMRIEDEMIQILDGNDTINSVDYRKLLHLANQDVFIRDPEKTLNDGITNIEKALDGAVSATLVDDGLNRYTRKERVLTQEQYAEQYLAAIQSNSRLSTLLKMQGQLDVNGAPTSQFLRYIEGKADIYAKSTTIDNVAQSGQVRKDVAQIQNQGKGNENGVWTDYLGYSIPTDQYKVLEKDGLVSLIPDMMDKLDILIQEEEALAVRDSNYEQREKDDLIEDLIDDSDIGDANQRTALRNAMRKSRKSASVATSVTQSPDLVGATAKAIAESPDYANYQSAAELVNKNSFRHPNTILYESKFNPAVRSGYTDENGKREESWGLYQLNKGKEGKFQGSELQKFLAYAKDIGLGEPKSISNDHIQEWFDTNKQLDADKFARVQEEYQVKYNEPRVVAKLQAKYPSLKLDTGIIDLALGSNNQFGDINKLLNDQVEEKTGKITAKGMKDGISDRKEFVTELIKIKKERFPKTSDRYDEELKVFLNQPVEDPSPKIDLDSEYGTVVGKVPSTPTGTVPSAAPPLGTIEELVVDPAVPTDSLTKALSEIKQTIKTIPEKDEFFKTTPEYTKAKVMEEKLNKEVVYRKKMESKLKDIKEELAAIKPARRGSKLMSVNKLKEVGAIRVIKSNESEGKFKVIKVSTGVTTDLFVGNMEQVAEYLLTNSL